MTKKASKIDRSGAAQMSIFEAIRAAQEVATGSNEGTLDIRDSLRTAMNNALKACDRSRFQVAGEMSHLTGREISKFMLDSWTSEAKEGHRMPAEFIPAFCKAVGSTAIVALLAQAAGCFALPGPDALRSELQKIEEEANLLKEKKKRAKTLLKEMEG